MTRDSRNHQVWSLKEIEGDSAGYVAAQSAYRQDQDAAAAQRRADQDLERFTAAFLTAGGTKSGAGDAYRAKRDAEATEAATFADETARRAQRGATMGKV
jgi:hypothetical protein